MKNMPSKIELDGGIADQITVTNLRVYLDMVKENNSEAGEIIRKLGKPISDAQAVDYAYDLRLEAALNVVLEYFGERT